jgi:hypothetical protein
MKLYLFWTVPLSIIRSYSLYTQQWCMSYRFVDSIWAGSGSWSCCSKAVYKPVWHIPLLSVQWITPDDGQRNCPKHVVSLQNKFEKFVHLVGFIVRKFVMMHGHMTVKVQSVQVFLHVVNVVTTDLWIPNSKMYKAVYTMNDRPGYKQKGSAL